MSNYSSNPSSPNYMASDWGSSNTKYTAQQIDHIADKAKFAIQIVEQTVQSFDVIEKELVDLSNSTTPPSREAIKAFAYRIDSTQSQLAAALQNLKNMMTDIDSATDKIQSSRTTW